MRWCTGNPLYSCFNFDPTTILIATTAISVGGSILSGVSANSAAKEEAALQRRQAEIALAESKTAAVNEATNQTRAVQRQKLAYLSSGVALEGSPLIVLEDTRKAGQQQVDAILSRGSAQYELGMRQAEITKNKGRAALLGGILQGAASAGKGYQSYQNTTLKNPNTGKING